MSYEDHVASVRAARLKVIKRKVNTARNALEDAAFLLRQDYPHGELFIDNGSSISVLSDGRNEATRQNNILYHAPIEGGGVGVGGW